MTGLGGKSQTKCWTCGAWLWFHECMMTYQMPVLAVNCPSETIDFGGKTTWNMAD
jgi:hypothetical protein